MLDVTTRIDDDARAQLKAQAAQILGVPVDQVIVHSWDEVFPNTGGPPSKTPRIVGQAFTGFEVLGFQAKDAHRKIKCCIKPHHLSDCVWDEWTGNPDDRHWSAEDLI